MFTWMVLSPRCGTTLEGLQLAVLTWRCGTDMHALCAGHSSVRAACPRGARARPVSLSRGGSLGVSPVCHIPDRFLWCTSGNIFIKKSLGIEILELRVYACSVLTRVAGLWEDSMCPPHGVPGEFGPHQCDQEQGRARGRSWVSHHLFVTYCRSYFPPAAPVLGLRPL